MLLPLAPLAMVIPFAATTDAIPPFLFFFGGHSLGDILDNARPKPLQEPCTKFNPERRPLGY
jgi:hypothetical protein